MKIARKIKYLSLDCVRIFEIPKTNRRGGPERFKLSENGVFRSLNLIELEVLRDHQAK